jgi:hypothetical protein
VDDDALVRARVEPGGGGFDLTVASAGTPDNLFPGPFLIRGRNIRYDDTAGALLVDLSVVNHSRTSYPEPVGLTFMSLLPEGVEVLNPDNDIQGPGAAIVFDFANDDALWTPGEESLPRPVEFSIESGQAVAFVARIDIGAEPDGAIGGVAWNDADRDGQWDIDELGVGGVEITLARGDYENTAAAEVLYRTTTDRFGFYRFSHLPADFYTVTRTITGDCQPTTATQIQVILVETDTGVSRFESVNFGCDYPDPPPPPDSTFVFVYDWIEATGMWDDRPMAPFAPALFARTLRIDRCGCPPPCLGPPCRQLPYALKGPVTDLNLDRNAVQVMGTWLLLPVRRETEGGFDIQPYDLKIGDRVAAGIYSEDGLTDPVLISLERWEKDYEVVSGHVNRVYHRPDGYGRPLAAWVFNTRVELTTLTTDG